MILPAKDPFAPQNHDRPYIAFTCTISMQDSPHPQAPRTGQTRSRGLPSPWPPARFPHSAAGAPSFPFLPRCLPQAPQAAAWAPPGPPPPLPLPAGGRPPRRRPPSLQSETVVRAAARAAPPACGRPARHALSRLTGMNPAALPALPPRRAASCPPRLRGRQRLQRAPRRDGVMGLRAGPDKPEHGSTSRRR